MSDSIKSLWDLLGTVERWDRAERTRILADHTEVRNSRMLDIRERCATLGHAEPKLVQMLIGYVTKCSLCGTVLKDGRHVEE